MPGDDVEATVKREVEKARRIIQSDLHAANLKGLSDRFDKHFPDNSGKDDGPPDPPPPVDPKEPPKKNGIWWP